MKKAFSYILLLIAISLESCCDSGGEPSHVATIENALRMKSSFDTIYTITYPNSDYKITPNSFKSNMPLSYSNEYTTLYIYSTKGYDTITIKVKQDLSYEKTYCTSYDYLIKNIERAKLIYDTYDTSFFKYYEQESYGYRETHIYDTLIVD
jgi:hypothetical protein